MVVKGICFVWRTERVCDNHGWWVIDQFQILAPCCFTGVLARVCPACVGGLVC